MVSSSSQLIVSGDIKTERASVCRVTAFFSSLITGRLITVARGGLGGKAAARAK